MYFLSNKLNLRTIFEYFVTNLNFIACTKYNRNRDLKYVIKHIILNKYFYSRTIDFLYPILKNKI
ncbi:hypothetical protein UT300016_29250 [Clostridium senegalense]